MDKTLPIRSFSSVTLVTGDVELLVILKVNKRIHTGEKPFQCPLCDKRFSTSGYMTKHKTIHTGDEPYTCKECLRSFSHKSNLMSHNKSQHLKNHTEEKLFQCDSCDKRWTTSSKLTEHKRIHTGEKPFQCTHCDKRFTR